MSSDKIRNVIVAGRRTSVRLEPAMWEALHDIAARQDRSIHDLATEIARDRTIPNLTAAIRVYVVEFYRDAFLRSEIHRGHTGDEDASS